ncbi:MAG: DUF3667 domain-containing protein [Flavobacteriales bacterium]|nr:DUF3667 domain-containing protein [Flavobacteriales bacterium]
MANTSTISTGANAEGLGFPCPNCGHSLHVDDQFCTQCGQSTKDLKRPVLALLKEFVSLELGWDAKLWTTLRRLLFKPGALTLELMEGRRRGQVPPVRLYLFISVVYFLLLNFSLHREFDRIGHERFGKGKQVLSDDSKLTIGGINVIVSDAKLYKDMSDAQLDSVLVAQGHVPTAFDRATLRRASRLSELQGIEQMMATVVQNISYLLFLLMPLMGVLFWLFFRRRRPWYIDHLFMAIHLHCFLFLLLALLNAVDILTAKGISLLSLPIMLVYVPMATKRVYGMRWPATITRSLVILLLQFMLVLAASLAALVLAVFRM